MQGKTIQNTALKFLKTERKVKDSAAPDRPPEGLPKPEKVQRGSSHTITHTMAEIRLGKERI